MQPWPSGRWRDWRVYRYWTRARWGGHSRSHRRRVHAYPFTSSTMRTETSHSPEHAGCLRPRVVASPDAGARGNVFETPNRGNVARIHRRYMIRNLSLLERSYVPRTSLETSAMQPTWLRRKLPQRCSRSRSLALTGKSWRIMPLPAPLTNEADSRNVDAQPQ